MSEQTYPPVGSPEECKVAFDLYSQRHASSLGTETTDEFWATEAKKYLTWFSPFNTVKGGSFIDGDVHWFRDGKLNACYNCVDRHIPSRSDQVALLWEGDEPGTDRRITYHEMYQEVCRVANIMKAKGVKKGDVVTIYMPMVPELVYVMLACSRLGAIHSVVFAGFSAESLWGRIQDCDSRFVFTADEGRRGGKTIHLKDTVDKALAHLPVSTPPHVTVFVYSHTGSPVNMVEGRDHKMADLLPAARPYCPCEWMDSEDLLFILYTSGSTGKPKGLAHSTGGYLLNAALTTKTTFDIREGDIFCCAADCGWITGHTYILYGPLLLGSTTTLFESVPTYPNPYRYWDMVQKFKCTQFYTAPTAIRALMRHSPDPIASYDLSSLRVLGSVGEPINPEAWRWYFNHVGRGRCTVTDTYWQTETGAHLSVNIPGAMKMKPGSCSLPCVGIDFLLVDPSTGKEILRTEENQDRVLEGVLCIRNPFPSLARTVFGDHCRYLSVYMKPYPGFYFTGDGARMDPDGYLHITGRVDDVINPSGHRIGTAEIESALILCPAVSESAVIGFPHAIKGEGIGCFVILKEGVKNWEEGEGEGQGIRSQGYKHLVETLKDKVREQIGPIATPDFILFSELPKTRSGKIMRRILRKVAHGEEDSIGDVSTLADPAVVTDLIRRFHEIRHTIR